jgi:hypothetical protein
MHLLLVAIVCGPAMTNGCLIPPSPWDNKHQWHVYHETNRNEHPRNDATVTKSAPSPWKP